jgi:predicted YcjX-like family ATPase
VTDPLDRLLAAARAASDQNVAFYTQHVTELVKAFKKHLSRYDRDVLLNNSVKALMESDNDREALAYQVVVAVDMLARRDT